MKFTEAQLEQAFIDLLGQEQIPYAYGDLDFSNMTHIEPQIEKGVII